MSVRSSCSSTEARVQPHTVTPNFWHRKLVDHTQPNKTAASTGNGVASATTSSAALFIRPDVAAVLTSGAAHTTINKVPVHLDTTPAQGNVGQEKSDNIAAPRPAECAGTAAAALPQPHRHRRRGGAHSRATSAAESNGIASPSLAAGTTSFMVCAAPAASSEAVGTSNTAANSGPAQAPDHICKATAAATSSLTVDTQSSSCTGGVTTTTTATETQGNRNASEEPARQEEVKQAVVHKHAKNTSIIKVKGPASIEELRALRNRTIPLAGSNSTTASANHASSNSNNSNTAQPSAEENEVIEEISKLLLHYCVGRDRKRVVDTTTTTTAGPGPGVVLFPKPASLPSSLAPLDSGMPSGPHRVLKPNKQPHYTKDIVLPNNTNTTTQSADPVSQSSSTTEPKSLDVTHWPTLEEAAAAAKAGRQHKATTRSSNSSGLSTPSPAQKPNTAEDNTSQKEKDSDEQKAMPSPEPTPALATTTDASNPPATAPAVQPTRSVSSNENAAAVSAGGVAPSPSPATTTNTTTNRAGNSLPMASSASHVEDDEDDPVAQELELYSQLVRLYQTKKVTLSTLTLVHEMLLHTRVIPHMSNASGFAGQPHNNSVTSRRRSYLQQLIMVLLNEMMQQKYKEECQRNAAGSTGEGQLPLHPPLPIHPPVLPIPSRAGRGPHTTMPVMPSSTLPPALLGATPSIHVGPRPHNNNNNSMNNGTTNVMPMWDMPNTRAAGGPSSGSKSSRRRGNSNNTMASVSPSESNSASFALSTGPPLQGCGQSPYLPMMMPNGLFMPPAPMMWPPFAATPTGAPMPSAEPQSCTTVFPRQVVGPMSMSESRTSGTLGRPAVHTLRPDAVAPPSSAMTFHPLTGMLTAPPCAERPQFDLHALTAKPKKSKKAHNANEEDSDDASDEMDEEEDEVQDLLKFINEQAEAEAVKGFASCPPTPAESPSQQRIPSTPEGITPTVNISQAERIILRTVQLDFKERAKQQSAALVAPLSLPPAASITTNTNATTEEILFDFDAERAEVTRPIFDSPRETCEDATMPTNTNTEAAEVDMNATDEVKDGQSMQEPQQPSFHFAEAANQAEEEDSSSRVRAEGSPQEESTCRALLFAEREAAETRVEMSSTAQPSLHTTSHTETSASRQAESEMNDSAALGPCESGVIGQGRHEAATLPLPINAQPLLELGKMDFRPTTTTSVTPPLPSTTGTTQEEKPEKVGGDAFVMTFVPARPPRHHNRGGRSRRRGKEANARSRQQQQQQPELFAAPRMRAPSVPPTSLNTNAAPFVPITGGNAAAVPFYELSPRPHMINTAASRRSVGSTLNRDAAPFVPMHIPPMEPPMAMPYFL